MSVVKMDYPVEMITSKEIGKEVNNPMWFSIGHSSLLFLVP